MGLGPTALIALSIICFGFFGCCREQPIQGSKKEDLKRFKEDSGVEFLASLPLKLTFSDKEIDSAWEIYKNYKHEFRWHEETFKAIISKNNKYFENVFNNNYSSTNKIMYFSNRGPKGIFNKEVRSYIHIFSERTFCELWVKHHVTLNLIEADGEIVGFFRSHCKQSLIKKFKKLGFYPPKSRGEYFKEIDEIWRMGELFKKIKINFG